MGLVQFIADLFSPSSKPRSGSDPRHALGRRGEKLAAKFLRKNGHKILCKNFRPKAGGEVDIVCRDTTTNELVFAEVKTRSQEGWGRPADAVTRDKEEFIARGARRWIRLLDRQDVNYRFDIIEIIIGDSKEPHINQIKAAFCLPESRRK